MKSIKLRLAAVSLADYSQKGYYVAGRRSGVHLLVLGGGDLLQEVGNALALGQPEAQPREEGQHLLARPMKHHMPCITPIPQFIQKLTSKKRWVAINMRKIARS